MKSGDLISRVSATKLRVVTRRAMPEIQARSLEHRRRVSAKAVNRRVTAVPRASKTGFCVRDNRGETVPSGVSARITDAIRRRLTYASQRANVCYGIVAHRSRFKFWVGVNAVPIRGIRIETAPASWIGGRGLYPLVRMVSETPR